MLCRKKLQKWERCIRYFLVMNADRVKKNIVNILIKICFGVSTYLKVFFRKDQIINKILQKRSFQNIQVAFNSYNCSLLVNCILSGSDSYHHTR